MKKILYLLLFIPFGTFGQTQIVNVGTAPNDHTGDPLRTAFQKVNTNTYAVQDSFGNIYRESQTRNQIRDTLNARLAAATPIGSLSFMKADVNTSGNPIDLEYFNANNTAGGGRKYLRGYVGKTNYPAAGDSTLTHTYFSGKFLKVYREGKFQQQHTDNTTEDGYKFSGTTITFRPVLSDGEQLEIHASNADLWEELVAEGVGGGNYFTETFEAAGYDNAVWSETVGVGSTVDEDEAVITPPTGGGSQTLKTQKVSPNFNASTEGTLAAAQVVSYTTFYVNITAQGLASTEVMGIADLWIAGYADDMAAISLYVDSFDSDRLKFICEVNTTGTGTTSVAWPGAGSAVALNTWHKINIKYDVTGNTYEFKITPQGGATSTVMSGALTDTHPTAGLKIIRLGNISSSETSTIYFDNVAVSTTAYPTF